MDLVLAITMTGGRIRPCCPRRRRLTPVVPANMQTSAPQWLDYVPVKESNPLVSSLGRMTGVQPTHGTWPSLLCLRNRIAADVEIWREVRTGEIVQHLRSATFFFICPSRGGFGHLVVLTAVNYMYFGSCTEFQLTYKGLVNDGKVIICVEELLEC